MPPLAMMRRANAARSSKTPSVSLGSHAASQPCVPPGDADLDGRRLAGRHRLGGRHRPAGRRHRLWSSLNAEPRQSCDERGLHTCIVGRHEVLAVAENATKTTTSFLPSGTASPLQISSVLEMVAAPLVPLES